MIYKVCIVNIFNKALSYIYNDINIVVGDYVIVPYGKCNDELSVKVLEIKQLRDAELPVSIDKMKYVIRKDSRIDVIDDREYQYTADYELSYGNEITLYDNNGDTVILDEVSFDKKKRRIYIRVTSSFFSNTEMKILNIYINNLEYKIDVEKYKWTENDGYTLFLTPPFPFNISYRDIKFIDIHFVIRSNDKYEYLRLSLQINLEKDVYNVDYKLVQVEEIFENKTTIQKEIIKEKYDKLKNSHTISTIKVKSIAETIAYMYKYSKEEASSMWTYLYETNKDIDEKHLKYYTHSIFNQLEKMLSTNSLGNLILMNTDILNAVCRYTGLLDILISFMDKNDLDSTLMILKYELLNTSETDNMMSIILRHDNRELLYNIFVYLSKHPELGCLEYANIFITDYNGFIDNPKSLLFILDICNKGHIENYMIYLLYKYRNLLSNKEINDFFIEYCLNNDVIININDEYIENYYHELLCNHPDIIRYYLSSDSWYKYKMAYIISKILFIYIKRERYSLFTTIFMLAFENGNNFEQELIQFLDNIIKVLDYEKNKRRPIKHNENIYANIYGSIDSYYKKVIPTSRTDEVVNVIEGLLDKIENKDNEYKIKYIRETIQCLKN